MAGCISKTGKNFWSLIVDVEQNHFLALIRVNNERGYVIAWGESKYGKLGVGNVAAKKAEKGKTAQNEASGENSSFTTSLSPTRVDRLREQEISFLSSYADHCLAVSVKTGSVFAWGFGNNGRLGLGDGEDAINKVEQSPKYLKFFAPPAVASDDYVDEEAQVSGGEDEAAEEETDEKGKGEKEENDALTVFANLRQALSGNVSANSSNSSNVQTQDQAINQALSALLLERNKPRERFQKIQHAVTLMKYAEMEYEIVEDRYLRAMDEIEEQGEMIQLALEHRIAEAKVKTKKGRDRVKINFKGQVYFVCAFLVCVEQGGQMAHQVRNVTVDTWPRPVRVPKVVQV